MIFMKKVVCYVGILLVVINCILVGYILNNDKNYCKDIIKKFDLEDISYVNMYDDKYIILDEESVYLYNKSYEEILKINKEYLCDKENDYEIIYRDEEFQYLKDYYKDNKLVYEYINAYNCKFIEKIVLGGL